MSGSCKDFITQFYNQKIQLPSSVEASFHALNMTFYPPAYYYKTDSVSYEIILGVEEQSGDNDDRWQRKETLFSRKVHSYIFRIKATEDTYDSLKLNLEKQYYSTFKLTKGIKYIPENLPERHRKLLEPDLPFESILMKVDNCLTIGIRRSKSEIFGKSVTVQFMYNLPLGKIGNQMDSY